MKWINHKLTTLAIFYTVSGDIIQSFIASASSTLPDLVEIGPGKLIFKKHRGVSHNPLFWLGVLPLLYYLLKKTTPEVNLIPLPYLPNQESLFFAIAAGVVLHLGADSLSSYGIPLFGNKRIAVKAYKTFTFSEFSMVLFILLSCGLSFIIRMFLLP